MPWTALEVVGQCLQCPDYTYSLELQGGVAPPGLRAVNPPCMITQPVSCLTAPFLMEDPPLINMVPSFFFRRMCPSPFPHASVMIRVFLFTSKEFRRMFLPIASFAASDSLEIRVVMMKGVLLE